MKSFTLLFSLFLSSIFSSDAVVNPDSIRLFASCKMEKRYGLPIITFRFNKNVLDQSRQGFQWAMGGFVGVFALVAAAILVLLVRPLVDASNLAAIITALGGVPSGLLAAYLLNLHKRASDQAAASQVNLDRIQRFFIAITVSSHVKEESRDEARVALLKKLNDL